MSKILSSEIVSLVHHVKLNESGWWEKSIQNIIISIFGINENAPQTKNDILINFTKELNTDFDSIKLVRQLEILKSKKIVISYSEELYILSEESYSDFRASFTVQKEIEFEAEKLFNELCIKICPEIEKKKIME